MRNKVLQLEALTPEELKGKLAGILREVKLQYKFIATDILGNQAIVRNFELPILAKREIKNALRLEAVEMLALLPDDIEIDYQIINTLDGKYKGIFEAIPKSILKDYYAAISKAGFIPLALTAKILTAVNAALTQIPSSEKAFYILDFAGKKSVFLALFNEGQCELLRDISYDDIIEARQEIGNSLHYALGKSTAKHPEELYFSGEIEGKDELIANLEKEFNVKGKAIDLKAAGAHAQEAGGYFQLNLIKKYTVSLSSRRKLHLFLNLAVGIAFLAFIFAYMEALRLNSQIKDLKREFNPSKVAVEYSNKIKDLQEKIKLLENEK